VKELEKIIEDGLDEMEEILNGADVGRMALLDDPFPYIIPLNFLYERGKVVFHCSFKGKKIDLLLNKPNCCFEVDEFMGEVSFHYLSRCHLNYDSVLAFGKARIENEEGERIRLLQLFGEKYDESFKKSISDGGTKIGENQNINNCCCIVVDIEELTGRRERTVNGVRQKTYWHYKFKD